MTVQTSITLTRDQAERCMREDAEFEVRAVDIFHMTPGGDIQYFNLNFNQWRPPFNSWQDAVEEAAKFNNITIHSDPNNTYDKLFGKTDMTNETEQKYLTRSEALHELVRGERVFAPDDLNTEFWLDGNDICSTLPGGHLATAQLFFTCDKFTLVPQPDSPEKLVRDMAELLKRDPKEKSLFWLCEKATPDTHDYTWRQRFDALIQQMDKEGK